MMRLLNLLALVAVIGSATWAYTVKYETILAAEKLRKREAELGREQDAVAVLKAEWHLLNRPERLQTLAKPEAGMQQLSARQVVRAADVPQAQPSAGDRIDDLLTGSIPLTPDSARKSAAATTPKPKSAGATTPGTAKSASPRTADTKTTPRAPQKSASAAPVRLTPPARVGAAPGSPPEPQPSGGLSGFLKRLIQ
jgi:hypothetical protein